jgi:RimJ/RimL family protein N-acetyltransferase
VSAGAKAEERSETARLLLRRPRPADAEAVFARYASDPDVTRLLSFRRHGSVADTRAFLAWSDTEWERWPAGPYLIESRETGALLGSTGLAFETPRRAATGYVLAKDAWGLGYATEALARVVEIARGCGVVRLYALCHPDHPASLRVLEKCGFEREGTLRRYAELPNLRPGEPVDLVCCSRVLA